MNTIAIDSGFGFMKAIVNQHKIKFANIFGNYRPSSNGMMPDSERELSIKVDGLGEWNFGDTAIYQSSTKARRQSGDRIFSNEFLAGLLLSISQGYSSETREIVVNVVTGLPGSEFNRDKQYKDDFRKFILGSYQIQRPGYKQQITINKVNWTQQAWGSIWRHLITKNGFPLKPDIKNADEVLIGNVNIGYNTLEIGTVRVWGIQSGNLRIKAVEGSQKSTPSGVHTIIDSLITDLSAKFQLSFEAERAIKIMEDGGLVLNGQWQDYQLSDAIRQSFSETVYSNMTNVYGNDVAFLYRLILTGGGANIVKDRFNTMPQLQMSDSPQWDTVGGYLRFAKLMNRSK